MKKHINKWIFYKIINETNNMLSVIITEQSHIGNNFGDNNYIFTASDGYDLMSITCPQVSGHNICYVRGDSKKDDNDILIFNEETFKRFKLDFQ